MLDCCVHVAALVGGYPLAQCLLGVLRKMLGIARRLACRSRLATGKQSLHRIDHLRDTERLFDVLLDPIVLLEVLGDAPAAVYRAHHNDRNMTVFGAALDAPRDVEAVQLGQHRIEDDEVGYVLFDEAQGEQAPVRLDDAMPLLRKQSLE